MSNLTELKNFPVRVQTPLNPYLDGKMGYIVRMYAHQSVAYINELDSEFMFENNEVETLCLRVGEKFIPHPLHVLAEISCLGVMVSPYGENRFLITVQGIARHVGIDGETVMRHLCMYANTLTVDS